MAAKRTCSVQGCEKPLVARGWCRSHYHRWWRSDRPQEVPPTLAERFWAKVDKNGPVPGHRPDLGPCWVWTARLSGGYGHLWEGKRSQGTGRMEGAHRVAWRLAQGPIPEGMYVLHHCDNPACVRVVHLFLGTLRDNNGDRHAKGRTVIPDNRGERHGLARLRESDVVAIRAERAAGVTQDALAHRYGVSRTAVAHVVHGRTWAHVGDNSGAFAHHEGGDQ